MRAKTHPDYLCRPKKNTTFVAPISPDGGIGRRAGLKHRWSNPSRFDPGSGYQAVEKSNLPRGFPFTTV